jgi:hypothetical protein
MKTVVRFIPRNAICTQACFRFRLALLWLFTLLWLAVLIFVGRYWGTSWYVKLLILIPLVLTTPDVDSLLMTYEKFKAMFVQDAKLRGSSEPGAAPNGGPAMRPDSPGAGGGPPSVS